MTTPIAPSRDAGAALALGTRTRWGRVAAVGMINGERYYWFASRQGRTETVAMLPAATVENDLTTRCLRT